MATDLSKPVNLVTLLTTLLPCARPAAECLLAHGQVTIDGYTMALAFNNRWTGYQLYGRILKARGQEFRLFGSRLARDAQGSFV